MYHRYSCSFQASIIECGRSSPVCYKISHYLLLILIVQATQDCSSYQTNKENNWSGQVNQSIQEEGGRREEALRQRSAGVVDWGAEGSGIGVARGTNGDAAAGTFFSGGALLHSSSSLQAVHCRTKTIPRHFARLWTRVCYIKNHHPCFACERHQKIAKKCSPRTAVIE